MVAAMRDKVEQAEQAQIPEPAAVEVEQPALRSGDLALASAVGNRAMAMAVASQRGSAGTRRLSRDGDPPGPGGDTAPGEPAKDEFKDADKDRARKMVIAPLRAAAAQLETGPKANFSSISRHLRPVQPAVMGVNWQPADVQIQAFNAVEELPAIIDLLDSLKLSDRQVIQKTKQHWAAAKRDLRNAEQFMQKQNIPDAKHPDRLPRDGFLQDYAAVTALEEQVDATIKDLAQAPRTQEGYKAVEDTAAGIADQFSTVNPIDDAGNVLGAKGNFIEGIGQLAPLALGKEDAIKGAKGDLIRMADNLAQLVGDEPAESPKEDPDPDPSANPSPPTPAPQGPNPLPPPPAPGGSNKPATPAAPAPAGAR
jgi:hypothetical protein